ncbi:MAG: toprim domain-containing protein [Aquificae bacterium]|nr:toprim domain-containing protein [Aquificota bacterium]
MEFESLENWIERLKNISKSEGVVILVEGKNDAEKLKKLGIKNIYPIKGKRFYDILEELENSSMVVVLTDLDKQGKKISDRLSGMLQREGIPVDNLFRQGLERFEIKHVEDIPLRSKDAGKKDNTLP